MSDVSSFPVLMAVSSQQVVWAVVWAGLIVLTVAMLVLMRTQWGQSQPLRKCAVLSLLAHLLFGCYATTVEIVHTAAQIVRESMPVTISSIDDDPNDSSEPESSLAQSWDNFSATAGDFSWPESLNRPALPAADQPSSDKFESVADLLPTSVAESAGKPAPAAMDVSEFGRQEMPVNPAMMLDAPAPQRVDEAAVAPTAESTLPQAVADAPVAPSGDDVVDPPMLNELPTAQLPSTAATPNPPTEKLASEAIAPATPLSADSAPAASVAQAESSAASSDLLPLAELPRQQTAGETALERIETARRSSPTTPSPLDQPPPLSAMTAMTPAVVPPMLQLRVAPDRAEQAERRGGSAQSEAAVTAALDWLAGNQSADGRWDASQFQSGRELQTLGQDRPGAGANADNGVTGLALLAFLGAGHTHLNGPYQPAVERGLEYLRRTQRPDGNLGGNANSYELMYCHGMATIAMSEAYALTQDNRLDAAVRRAVAYTLTAQHKSTGGWRYRPGDLGDTSQLGWQLMALKSAELAGISVPPTARDGVLRFLRSVTFGRASGIASYRPGEQASRAMTAEALVCRQFLGLAVEDPTSSEATAFILEEMPTIDHTNVYYWYYATLALYRMQGEPWQQWNAALQAALLPQQRTEGDLAGSWDPDPVWGGYGGRVYSTALSALCLEVYYRYLPLHVEAASRDRRVLGR